MKRSFIIAALLAVGATAWIVSGQLGSGENKAEARKPAASFAEAERVQPVRVRTQSAQPYTAEEVLRGRTEALRSVVIKAETHGRVVEMQFARGDKLEEDQVIVKLAPESRPARLNEAKALREQRQIEYDAAQRLKEKGFRAKTQLAAAQAALESAKADVRRAQVDLNNTSVRAPFDGVADERMVDLGDFVEMGDQIGRIVDLDPILVVAEVNERKVGRIEVGSIGQARLATGLELAGRIRFVASMANVATRTFRVEMEVPNPDGAIPDGVSAELKLPLDEQPAHLVSPAILTLSDEGVVGVMTLEPDSTVRFRPVQILDNTEAGIWLGGLPERLTFVTVGQEFVKDGQAVEAVDERDLTPVTPREGATS